jgi:hypothetical protein
MEQEATLLSASVIEMIREGDMDEALDDLSIAITLRRQKISGEKHFSRGQTVKVIGKLRPNYLFGHTFPVLRVLGKTVEVQVPLDAKYRRYAGNKTRIPKTALEIV